MKNLPLFNQFQLEFISIGQNESQRPGIRGQFLLNKYGNAARSELLETFISFGRGKIFRTRRPTGRSLFGASSPVHDIEVAYGQHAFPGVEILEEFFPGFDLRWLRHKIISRSASRIDTGAISVLKLPAVSSPQQAPPFPGLFHHSAPLLHGMAGEEFPASFHVFDPGGLPPGILLIFQQLFPDAIPLVFSRLDSQSSYTCQPLVFFRAFAPPNMNCNGYDYKRFQCT
ncbi:MAG: hypothetical protein R6U43_08590 [Candidatus Krumholzibacteriales bacterium]